ncbi:MAG: family 16 glycoside hydrolase [Cyclobacteriaceae bacterium]
MKNLLASTLAIIICMTASGQSNKKFAHALTSTKDIAGSGIKMEASTFKGKKAIRITTGDDNKDYRKSMVAKILNTDFHNGVIEVEVASQPEDNAPEGSRGFAGVTFRMQDDFEHYECIYIRPTNGRADDQLRRNHSTQYISAPDYPWYRLRKENPGVYESYVDLVPGEWTKLRIEVNNDKAKFFVNDSSQPVLIINDLKYGADQRGYVGLWIGSGTDAYFSNLKITHN